MMENPWDGRIQRAEAAAIAAARALLVAAGACARWLVADGRAVWLGSRAQALVTPMQHASAVSPGVDPIAATEAYVRVLLDWLGGYGVDARLAGLAGEPDAAIAARRDLEAA